MRARNITAAGVFGGALLLASVAMAAPGTATGNVNMRTGPGTQYNVITTIPAGARVDVRGCSGWCRVTFSGRTGYVAANYIATGYARMPPPVRYQPAPPPRIYWDYDRRDYRDRDRWRHHRHDRWDRNGRWDRGGPGVGFHFGFGR